MPTLVLLVRRTLDPPRSPAVGTPLRIETDDADEVPVPDHVDG
jgi:hypothetical protein